MTRTNTPADTRADKRDVAIATAGAVATAALVMLACLVMPTSALEALVTRSGLAAMVNAAAPPLGLTARLLLATMGGAFAAAIGWAVLVLVVGERRVRLARPVGRVPAFPSIRRRAAPAGPSVRRADFHPDAPPRPPILAERELGVPFLSIVAPPATPAVTPAVTPAIPRADPMDERPLPADLDTALAAIDPDAIPDAIPDAPREPVRAVPALTVPPPPHRPVPLAPGERIDSVQLGAAERDRPDSIEALLSRLERGTRRRASVDAAPLPPPPESPPLPPPPTEPPMPAPVPAPTASGSLEETLGQLRRLAIRG